MQERATVIRTLVEKRLLEQELTPVEEGLLNSWLSESTSNQEAFNTWTNDEKLLALVTEYGIKADFLKSRYKSRYPKEARSFAFRRVFIRYSAVAALLCAISFGGYLFIGRRTANGGKQAIVNNQIKGADIPAARMRATLTLADNRIVELDEKRNGVIAQEGNTSIHQQDGQLIYQAAHADNDASLRYNTVSTPKGGFYRVNLPDGSLVWLNAASALTFPTEFRGAREVRLTGEGFFQVTRQTDSKGTRIPFLVKMETGSTIEVVGTQFNVNNYTDFNASQPMTATLVEGRVKIHTGVSGEDRNTTLTPGQRATVNVQSNSVLVEKGNVKAATAWTKELFYFEGATLERVMQDLSRWYDVDVVYGASVDRKGSNINGGFQRSIGLQQVLLNLEPLIKTVRFSIMGKTIYIESK
jgi:transmembrane sensor